MPHTPHTPHTPYSHHTHYTHHTHSAVARHAATRPARRLLVNEAKAGVKAGGIDDDRASTASPASTSTADADTDADADVAQQVGMQQGIL